MADQRIIDLTAQTVVADTDLYENSKNGTGSQKETRLQMRNAMQAVFDARYNQRANNLSDVASKTVAFNNVSPITTKGDLISSDGVNNDRLAVGTDGQSLVADSTQPLGVRWAIGANSPSNIIAWSDALGPQQMLSGHGYTAVNALIRAVFTLPVAPSEGDIVIVHGYGGGGFQINVGTAGMLRIGNQLAVANIQSNSQWDSISLRCVASATGGQWKGEAVQSAGFIIN